MQVLFGSIPRTVRGVPASLMPHAVPQHARLLKHNKPYTTAYSELNITCLHKPAQAYSTSLQKHGERDNPRSLLKLDQRHKIALGGREHIL
jgi:hypothetical protein